MRYVLIWLIAWDYRPCTASAVFQTKEAAEQAREGLKACAGGSLEWAFIVPDPTPTKENESISKVEIR